MILQTKRLILRGPEPRDLEPMFATYSDTVAMRYWSCAPYTERQQAEQLLQRRMSHWAISPINFQITIDNQYIGNAGNVRDNEIGFMLHPDYWRRGILTEAMGMIIPYLWEATDHSDLFADADPLNAASCGLLRKLGFHETHRAKNTFCINGTWSDSVYFALPRPPASG